MPDKTSFLTFLTHSLSASGAIIALFALDAVYIGAWERTFLWLGLALIIDGIDGPIARWVGVKNRSRFSGARIDLIVDYLNYVFVPAIAFIKLAFLPFVPSLVLASFMLLSALFHFSDTMSKSEDHSFLGFPAIWNVVVFYLIIFQPSALLTFTIISLFAALTFLPLRWSHPFRNRRFRSLTLIATMAGAMAALWILNVGFPAPAPAARIILAVAAFYGLILVILNATIWRDVRGIDEL